MNLDSYYTSAVPDLGTLQSVVNGKANGGAIYLKTRCRLLTSDLQVVALPNPPNKDDESDVSAYITAMTLDNNTTRDVHRSCTLTVQEIPGIAIDTLTQRIAVELQWCDPDFTPLISIPWGRYRFTWPDRNLNDALNTWSVQGDGLTQDIADLDGFANPYVIPNLTEASIAMGAMLRADYMTPSEGGRPYTGGSWPFPGDPALAPSGCENPGPNIPSTRLFLPNTGVQIPATTFARTQNQLAANNQIATTANCWKLYDDATGNIGTKIIPDYTLDQPDCAWILTTDESGTIQPDITQRLSDPTNMANDITIVSENNYVMSQGGSPIHVSGSNRNDASAISKQNLRRSIHKTIQDDRIIDLATARDRLTVELQKRASMDEQIELTTFPIPIDTHDYIGLYVKSPRGQLEITSDYYLFHVVSTSLDVVNRTMKITCQRAVGV